MDDVELGEASQVWTAERRVLIGGEIVGSV